MLLTPIELKDVPTKIYRNTKIVALLDEFDRMGCAAVEADISEYASAASAAAALRTAIKRTYRDHIKCIVNGGHLYMLNTIKAKGEMR